MTEREAYLYGRHNGLDDPNAADFAQWVMDHEPMPLNVALQAWLDEMDNFAMWQGELSE